MSVNTANGADPALDDVRDWYIAGRRTHNPFASDASLVERFDIWLAAHDEAVRADMQREVQTVEDWSDPTGYTGFWTASRRDHFRELGCDGTACQFLHSESAPYVDAAPVTPSTPNQTGAEQK